jgi:hypothetical protein
VAIFLYISCVVIAGAVLYANCSVSAGANTHVKGFADACHRGEEGVAKSIICRKDGEGERGREEVVVSLVKVELRRS